LIFGNKNRRRTDGFIERTLLSTVELLKETVSSQALASRPGLLQACDPRFKCAGVALMLSAVLVSKSIGVIAIYYCVCVALAMVSSIKLWFFLKRTLLFVPLFSLFIVLPAVFSSVTPGDIVFSFKVFGAGFSITRQGLDAAAIFFMRVLSSVSFAVVLVLTTRQHVLLKALRTFKVPRIFVMTMEMCFRYIFLLLDIVQKTFLSIKSRVGFVTSIGDGQKIVGANMAGLWLKSYRMHSLVYDAMVSRGYTGEPRALVEFHARPMDFIMFATALMALIGTLWINRFFL
jgi:cobalt/nickel transport system permease protein